MDELWKDIPGHEGIYQASNKGRIRSLDRVVAIKRKTGEVSRKIKGCVLRPGPSLTGHLSVVLNRDGIGTTHQVHTLVLETFVGPRPGHHTEWHGCHKDGNPTNNDLSNLRWDTRSGNEMDKVEHGRSNRGTRNRTAKLNESQAAEIKKRIKMGEASKDIAKDYGVTRGLVNAIKRGDAWRWL